MTNFHNQQTSLTSAKIDIYQGYIKGYLPKILMTFGKCFIADLFCGTGKNGEEKGSPLVLLDTAQYILTSEILKKKNPQIYILFNDNEAKNIENLKQELEGFIDESINIFPPQNQDFVDITSKILKQFKNNKLPKFFFLDPFTYSNIGMDHLRLLMELPYSEILLFIPIFHSYRFASDEKMKKNHKTRVFVEAFTKKGIADYENIDEFMQSVKEKLKEEIGLDFVRPVLLDGGSSKNALFLLTKNQEGMLYMNKVALKMSEDGKGANTKNTGQASLFGTQGTSKFEIFSKKLIEKLKEVKEMTNSEIVKFTIMEEFLPKYAKDILKDLDSKKKISVFDALGNNITKQSQWNIAEKITKNIIFRFNQ